MFSKYVYPSQISLLFRYFEHRTSINYIKEMHILHPHGHCQCGKFHCDLFSLWAHPSLEGGVGYLINSILCPHSPYRVISFGLWFLVTLLLWSWLMCLDWWHAHVAILMQSKAITTISCIYERKIGKTTNFSLSCEFSKWVIHNGYTKSTLTAWKDLCIAHIFMIRDIQ